MASVIFPRHREIISSKIKEVETIRLSKVHRFVLGFLAILATVLIFPRCAFNKTVKRWWNQAVSGVERKIAYRSLPKLSDPQVRFGGARVRRFNKDDPPQVVGDTPSEIFRR